jgi:hypothetical protein
MIGRKTSVTADDLPKGSTQYLVPQQCFSWDGDCIRIPRDKQMGAQCGIPSSISALQLPLAVRIHTWTSGANPP